MRVTRLHLRVLLGALWLFDGLLQCQPRLFTRAFAQHVLLPAQQGQPGLVSPLTHEVARLVLAHPALANGGFAFVQIALGIGLLRRRRPRMFVAGSVAWALSVWIIGEGFGGLTMNGSLLSGAPGAALLYAVIALLAWPSRDARRGDAPSRWAIFAWSALWTGGAALQVVNENNPATSLHTLLRNAQSGAPRWIARLDHHLLGLSAPRLAPALLVGLYVLLAIWATVPGLVRRLSLVVGSLIALTSWLVFQGLGDVTSGLSTDPNTGPLILVLALAAVGATRAEKVTLAPSTACAEESFDQSEVVRADRELTLV
ncbi:MAG: hypothetical protein KGI14_06080 [Acidobacteriota bacterium]|nr:hypothetical protein [Acidobacteriota bacterium]